MKKSLLLGIAIAFIGCHKKEPAETISTNKKQLYEKAGWLIGEWGNSSRAGVLHESWEHESDSVYMAKSSFVVGTDTVFKESVKLAERNGDLFYIVSVPGQNKEKPVSFKMASALGDSLVFENAQHDFPNRIVYRNFHGDSLTAVISGKENGNLKREVFAMKKVK